MRDAPNQSAPFSDPTEDEPLYESRRQIYQQSVSGRLRTIKWAVLFVCLGIYYFLPFLRWYRGPNLPDQAVLVDIAHNRFYFFFIEIWPQEIYFFTGLLVLAALILFLMNAVAGRVWCGYLCPQTVWTDLFMTVERWIEGERRERIIADSKPMTAALFARKTLKHFVWLMIAWWTGGAWVLYFADAPTLVRDLATLQAPMVAYVWIGILTFTTYALAGLMREQVCLYMCPWPRIQAALTDEYALNVTYRYDRGEPRMSVKAAAKARESAEPAGDCVDCKQCVVVCPTGVDIRDGSQLGCIQCGLCIDACNSVMSKVNRPLGLIAYDNEVNIHRRAAGEEETYPVIRPRTLVYVGLIAVIGAVMLYGLLTRTFTDLSVLHDRNPLFVTLSDGSIRNSYTVRVLNKRAQNRLFVLAVDGPPLATATAVGVALTSGDWPVIDIGPDASREVIVHVTAPHGAQLPASGPVTFRLTELGTGERVNVRDHFIAR
ncbi:cytochrome c oxidase accessory protein CcoG [Phreatobacter aquaticus]|uniref:Cytochrome c oxidase accessory protein CcoG n=1 Tax=Phreatobacter aquaticus TaxID=2570229 RepID=A0A4D7QS66_9HYPH|nr:cytochrome c oxidase accessory protein CcoG [Phreatobacter aquaticus]QCK88406.1 cytochrome c oxidase accessory protein CcoG [Phreatobacter aquaticus]